LKSFIKSDANLNISILGPQAKIRPGRDRCSTSIRLAEEFLKAYDSTGYAVNKKLAHHKIAEAQRQFANLYWSGKLVR
jgi:ribosomal protein S7